MNTLITQFNRITNFFFQTSNLELVGSYHHHPHTNVPLESHHIAHRETLDHAFRKYLYPHEINHITQELRRSEMTQDAILDDFFANDVEPHEIPFDTHVLKGLDSMERAFAPPVKCQPCHINDVEHHYPYKWQVNAEPPFSTDQYFLNNRKTFGEYYDEDSGTFTKYVDPNDAQRRYGTRISANFLSALTPAKFGFMKGSIFSWTRRWHHIIKSGFTDLTGLESTSYLKDRFIFPMLLHTKTAIVKRDDPNKMRTIWGCSKPWIIADTMFYWEYIAYLKLNPGCTPMLWGYETFTGGWLRLNAALFSSYLQHSFLTLDWKRFDKRAYFKLIHAIMLRVRNFLDFDNGYVPNTSYPSTSSDWSQSKAQKLQNLWLWTLECLYFSAIVLPDGRMYKRRFAGIPSGLFITQLLDSWYNYTMLATLLSALGLDPDACIIKVQGDDSIVRLGIFLPPDAHDAFLHKMQTLADFYFKAVISLEKSELRNELNHCEVLSYRHVHGLPYRDEIAMLAQFYHSKAKVPTPSITMAQAIGFAYASCGNNIRVLLVLEDVYNYYKSQGYEPNRAGLTITFGDSPDAVIPHYDLSHFPSQFEIKQFLLSYNYHNKEAAARTWPQTYFLNPPCVRTYV
uniref:Putative RNA-dependent RNA polymerase n=2 Tax=Heterobasidion partitivirus 5 TaxID=942043 RepID=E7E1F1_9VIRU|nr:putative RNA-dependent RNA polymerase [Heterobasidion partitivirus 5]